jgi:hypothetical protein
MTKPKICFVIAPIGDAESDTRKRSDQVLRHVSRPAVAEHGYEALRADEISEPGIITSQVIQHVVDDPLVIADLTESNPNVFYELAVRHVIRKPLVQIIRRGDTIPFDVAPMRTVQVDVHDLDSVEEARKEIVRQIETVEQDATAIDTPISVSLDLQALRQSDDPEERSLAELLAAVGELRSSLFSIERRLDTPEAIVPPEYLEWAISRSSSPAVPGGLFRDLVSFIDRLQTTAGETNSEAYDELREELNAMRAYAQRRARATRQAGGRPPPAE